MLPKTNPTHCRIWSKLEDHHRKIKDIKMKDLFASDPERFNKFHIQFKEILVDYSKNRITDETLPLLLELAEETNVRSAIKKMFSGEKINETEDRAVMHAASAALRKGFTHQSSKVRYHAPGQYGKHGKR